MDAFVLARVCRALERRWTGAWVQRVKQDRDGRLFLKIYREGRSATLLVSAVPRAAGLGITEERPASPPRPGALVSYLRAHAEGGRLDRVHALPYERVVRLDFSSRGGSVSLVLEALPREPRLLALDADECIRAADRWESRSSARSRRILPGIMYRPPDRPAGRFPPDAIDAADTVGRGGELPGILMGFPPWMRDEIEEARERFGAAEALRRYAYAYAAGGPLVREGGGLRLRRLPEGVEGEGEDDETLALAGRFLLGAAAGGGQPEHPPSWARGERKWRQRLERRLSKIEADLASCPDPAQLRATADALAGVLGQVLPGADAVELSDFPKAGERTLLGLDPRLSAGENMNRLYEAAKKAERTQRAVTARLELTRREIAAGYQPGEVRPAGGRVASKGMSPFRRYMSSDGWHIWAGRNGPENERLLREARPWDLWLHARGGAGAHVLVRLPGREAKVPANTLREAAGIAALHSRLCDAGSVDVMVAEAGRVRKVRDGAPGRVVVTGESTLRVPPCVGKARPL